MRAAVYRRFGGPDTVMVPVDLAKADPYRAVRDRTHDLAYLSEAHRFIDTGRKRGNLDLRLTTAGTERVPPPAEEQPRKAAS